MLKKWISILLILLLCVNSGGFILIFYQAQLSAKAQMFRSLQEGNYSSDDIVKFRLRGELLYRNGGGFLWKDAHEFEYNGQMYDIVKTVNNDGEIILYCLNDVSEAKVVAAFNNELNDLANGKLNNPKYRTSLLNLISQALCFKPFRLSGPEGKQKFSSDLRINIPNYITEIPSPPPKTA